MLPFDSMRAAADSSAAALSDKGELEGAQPASDWIKCPATPCRARLAASAARTFAPEKAQKSSYFGSFYFWMFWQKRARMAATWARVALPWGFSMSPSPVRMPLDTAQAMASSAQSLTLSPSVN